MAVRFRAATKGYSGHHAADPSTPIYEYASRPAAPCPPYSELWTSLMAESTTVSFGMAHAAVAADGATLVLAVTVSVTVVAGMVLEG